MKEGRILLFVKVRDLKSSDLIIPTTFFGYRNATFKVKKCLYQNFRVWSEISAKFWFPNLSLFLDSLNFGIYSLFSLWNLIFWMKQKLTVFAREFLRQNTLLGYSVNSLANSYMWWGLTHEILLAKDYPYPSYVQNLLTILNIHTQCIVPMYINKWNCHGKWDT